MAKQFTGCEIAEMGIEIEKNGREFYLNLLEKADTDEVKQVMRDLAHQEEEHIEVFRKIHDTSCDRQPKGAYPDEYFSYMNSLAGQYVFTQKGSGAEMAKKVGDCRQGIEMGIGFEKDSILLYQEMRELVPDDDKHLVDELIEQEKEHLRRLLGLKKGCSE